MGRSLTCSSAHPRSAAVQLCATGRRPRRGCPGCDTLHVRSAPVSGRPLGDSGMIRYERFGVLFLVAIATTAPALACVCVDLGSTSDQLNLAETVALGRVVGLAIRTKRVENETIEYTAATIKIERRWKGSRAEQVTVSTYGDQVLFCTCGVRFDLGGTYIIVTELDNQVSSCGLTRAAFPADDPLISEIDAHFKK